MEMIPGKLSAQILCIHLQSAVVMISVVGLYAFHGLFFTFKAEPQLQVSFLIQCVITFLY